MTPKELLLACLNHKETPRAPWVPFAGVHAGKLTGIDAETFLKDEDAYFNALMEVNKLYKPDGQPVVFDLQLEAECLGCELAWTNDGPPSVASHPLEGEEELIRPCKCKIPKKESGRIPIVLNVMKRMKEAVGETTALYGLICGPFTLAAHLRGNDIFMDMYDDEDATIDFLDFCNEVAKTVAGYFVEAGMDVIAVVDPLISQISSDHFEDFMTKPFSELFEHIKNLGAKSSFFVCGDATRNIDVMCQTKPDSISVDENVDIIAAKKITDQYNIVIGGNIPLTTIMLHGTQEDNMKYTIELMENINSPKNFIVAPGCDMPFNCPIENGIAVSQAVLEPESVKKLLENYVAVVEDIDIKLPDYTNLLKPLVEVFTLDSKACAACQYMWGAACAEKEFYGDKIDVIEYKFTEKENIARCKKMEVKNLPSIYINGTLCFSSIVPPREDFQAAINKVL